MLSAAAPALADTTDVYVQKANLTVSGCSIFLTAAEGHNYASLFYNNVHSGVVIARPRTPSAAAQECPPRRR